MTTKTFHIGDILTVITGRLVSPTHMDGVYDICSHLAGESVMTHQLPRISREAKQPLSDAFPDLAGIVVPDDLEGAEDVHTWLAAIVAEHGETRLVEPLGINHTPIDPITEIRMIRPDAEIITVTAEDSQETDRDS